MRYLRFLPSLRSAYIERFQGGPPAATVYLGEEYLDAELRDRSAVSYHRVTFYRLVTLVLFSRYDVLALPEPFWIVWLPVSTALAGIARLRSIATRRRVLIVTYAIENSDPTKLLGLPRQIPPRLRLATLRVAGLPYLAVLDRIAFGTKGAQSVYTSSVLNALHARLRPDVHRFTPLAPVCKCMPVENSIEKGSVLFLGPLEGRKGLDTLLQAWPNVLARHPQAHLTICGSGPLKRAVAEAVRRDASISHIETSSRDEVHNLLARSAILVSLPRAERRWREQIGLSLTEGLSHGCHIVTSEQTGFADWLVAAGQTVVNQPTPQSAADAIVEAIQERRSFDIAQLPTVSGRASAEWWMTNRNRPRLTS